MRVAGMITEYDPLHPGHVRLMEETRHRLGPDTGLICVMSGDFVQRGDFAVVRRGVRAAAAVESGADLVLELPVPWAVSSAEGFASGAVGTLLATGLVTDLAFGCESGDGAALMRLADALTDDGFPAALRQELAAGDSFAAARQRAVGRLTSPEDAALLSRPNDLLAVEYCKCLRASGVRPLPILRTGAPHGTEETGEGTLPSASAIRALLRRGETEAALGLMAPAMAERFRQEMTAGRAPVFGAVCERALLARLRSMDRPAFAALDEGREGLSNRLYASSRTAASLAQVLAEAKTRRYAYARLRRMVLWAYLGLTPGDRPASVPYLRPLAMNERGRAMLAAMRGRAAAPVLTKAADVSRLGEAAKRLFDLEARAADLYTLAYPKLSAAEGGSLWREGPWVAPAAERSPH